MYGCKKGGTETGGVVKVDVAYNHVGIKMPKALCF